jgi:hypothetical protein
MRTGSSRRMDISPDLYRVPLELDSRECTGRPRPSFPHCEARGRVCAFEQRVQMIAHETVREYFSARHGGGTQKPFSRERDVAGIDEVLALIKGAHRQENTLKAAIAVGRESRWTTMSHGGHVAIRRPSLG